jgi:hypothetical protein
MRVRITAATQMSTIPIIYTVRSPHSIAEGGAISVRPQFNRHVINTGNAVTMTSTFHET